MFVCVCVCVCVRVPKIVSFAQQGCVYHLFYQKYSKNNLVNFITIFVFNVIHACDYKAEFSASLLQSSVSHDPSEFTLICWFFYILNTIGPLKMKKT